MTARIRAVDIRTGGPADLPSVAPLMQAAFDPRYGEAWTTAQCMGMLALPGSWLTVVEREGLIIGFALSRATLDDGELLLIAVHPDARGAGVGRALLRAVIDDAKGRGVIRFNLEVRTNNPATAFYVAEGFVKIGERRDYYRGSSGQAFDALTFQKCLR